MRRRTESGRPALTPFVRAHAHRCFGLVWLLAAWLLPVLPPGARAAEEDADIVLFCHLSIGEFGYDAIDVCVKENQAARAEVQRYPAEVRVSVARCTRRWEPDWVMLQRCVDADSAAAAALRDYALEHAGEVQRCREQLGEDGDAEVKACVDRSLQAAPSDRGPPPSGSR